MMGHTWNNGLDLKKWVKLGKTGSHLEKIGHTWKNGSHLEKLATLGIMG